MNYIKLINDFWRFYDENKDSLNVSDIVLYKVLLRYCNKIGWVNPFTVNPYLMNEINPLSINTYYKSFKKLNDLKLIKWVKGKHNVSNQRVTILKIKNSTTTSLNNSVDTSLVNSLTNSVVSNNKTIKLLDYNTIKLLKEEDFNFLIRSTEFNKYLKDNKLSIQVVPDAKENSEKEIQTLKNIIFNAYSFNEINYTRQSFAITKFCQKVNIEHATNQIKSYFEYNSKDNNKFRVTYSNLIGSEDLSYNDGVWNKENWTDKLKNVNNIKSNGDNDRPLTAKEAYKQYQERQKQQEADKLNK